MYDRVSKFVKYILSELELVYIQSLTVCRGLEPEQDPAYVPHDERAGQVRGDGDPPGPDAQCRR